MRYFCVVRRTRRSRVFRFFLSKCNFSFFFVTLQSCKTCKPQKRMRNHRDDAYDVRHLSRLTHTLPVVGPAGVHLVAEAHQVLRLPRDRRRPLTAASAPFRPWYLPFLLASEPISQIPTSMREGLRTSMSCRCFRAKHSAMGDLPYGPSLSIACFSWSDMCSMPNHEPRSGKSMSYTMQYKRLGVGIWQQQ